MKTKFDEMEGSMEKKFEFNAESMADPRNSEHCLVFEVTIDVWGSCDGDYAYTVDEIYCPELRKRYSIGDLPDHEQALLNVRADKIAERFAYEAYEAMLEQVGDAGFEVAREQERGDQ